MRARGLTLAEILFCILLAVLGVLALISVVSYSLRARTKTTQRHEASLIATSMLNQSELDTWTSFSDSLVQPRQPVPGRSEYSYEILERLEAPDLKRVEVHVYWQDKQGPQEYVLWTKFVRED